jgi:hypothetical protein
VEADRVTDLLARLAAPLAGRYVVDRELGHGGMATVFLARDLATGRDAAIKVLRADLTAAVGADRFRREISIVRALHHPHILPLYDSGEAAGSLFYVMPYFSGESLRERIAREQWLPVDEAVRIACEVAGALDYAHQRGVVHRDIKPENVLLDGSRAVVADFGIARALRASGDERLTRTGITLGTPAYMSPEQAFAEHDVDGRSDIYSLACVLFEMLTGQPPFVGPGAQAVLALHAMEAVPSITSIRPTVPEWVEDAITRALAKARADRFATGEELIQALTAPGPRTGGRRRPTHGVPERRRRWDRRLVYAALAALPVAAAAAGAWWLGLRPAGVPAGVPAEDAHLRAVADTLWRRYGAAYDSGRFDRAVRWCDEGRIRSARDPRFVDCKLWLLSAPGVPVNAAAAWQLLDQRRAVTPPPTWPLVERRSRMLIGGGLARAGLVDSAHRVFIRARGSPGIDPRLDLVAIEAVMRAVTGDRDGAIGLLTHYLAARPEGRDGLAPSGSWWWRDLQSDPRFRALVPALPGTRRAPPPGARSLQSRP